MLGISATGKKAKLLEDMKQTLQKFQQQGRRPQAPPTASFTGTTTRSENLRPTGRKNLRPSVATPTGTTLPVTTTKKKIPVSVTTSVVGTTPKRKLPPIHGPQLPPLHDLLAWIEEGNSISIRQAREVNRKLKIPTSGNKDKIMWRMMLALKKMDKSRHHTE